MVKKFLSLFLYLICINFFSLDLKELKAFVEKERGLKFKNEIVLKKVSSKEAEQIIRSEIDTLYKNYSLKNYEQALKAFNLIPKKSELKEIIFTLLSSQAIAFYDTRSKLLYYNSDFSQEEDSLFDISSSLDLPSIYFVHELTHALIDQNFDIEKSLKLNDISNEDKQLAALAIVEGDATFMMLQYVSENEKMKDLNVNFLDIIKEIKSISDMIGEIAPLYLRETLVFPYFYGLNFFIKVKERGLNFNSLYKNPPISTEEIIHPEKYFSRSDPPKKLTLSHSKVEGEPIWEGTFGEFGIFLVLRSWGISEDIAKRASEGWGNDRYKVFKRKNENELTFIWETIWDSENDVNEFMNALKGKRVKIQRQKNVVIVEKE